MLTTTINIKKPFVNFVYRTVYKLNYHILSGKFLSKIIRNHIKNEICSIKKRYPSFLPTLKIIQVGNRSDSTLYVKTKQKVAAKCFISSEIIQFSSNLSEELLLNKIKELNNDSNVHSVMI